MTRYFLTALFSLSAISGAFSQDLFNGKDLTGWDGNPEFWRVENGVIVGETTAQKKTGGNTFLIWKGGEVGDFELTLKARVIGSNNSGIQYRSKVLDAKKWSVGGYQMDMHPSQGYFGMLYEERGRGIIAQRGQKVVIDDKGKKAVAGKLDASKKLDLSKWNEFSVIAKGNTLIHKVNGDVTSEVVDGQSSRRAMKGIIALQLHAGSPMRLEAKDIVLKKSDTAAAAGLPLSTTPTAALVAQVKADSGAARVHPKGFEIKKIYDVPKGQQGSWVSMAVDDKGRLYCGDQGGRGIFRITLGAGDPKVEKIPADITGAHGLLWAFDSLYVCLNGGKPGSGLYRVTDSNGDDSLDKIQEMRRFAGSGEHGPHAVVLAPDGENLFVIGGNHTKTPNPDSSALRLNYAEDQLLPRMTDARGHARGVRAPGGWVARTDKEGKSFHLYSAGFRNQYDVAFNPDGEMFTFDSDMEWDSGTPWYRPTRIYHVTSGSEFGWRTGTGKFPEWYPDVLPPTLDVGPGCPTGVVSGMGARFPAKYQEAIYAFDWTYGTIYAIHLTAKGGSYSGEKEEFVTGVPLNVSDGVIGRDGSMYFAVGGRNTQSALYCVKYTGNESIKAKKSAGGNAAIARAVRREMEGFHGRQVAGAVAKIWPHLGHADRSIRYASRVALEHQPVAQWQEKALAEKDPQTALSALLALTRQGDAGLQDQLLDSLSGMEVAEFSEEQKLEALRVLGLTFIRMGRPEAGTAAEVAASLSPLYPAASDAMNRELVAMLVYLGAPEVVAKTVPLMNQDAAGLEEIEFDDALLKRSGRYGNSFLNQKANNPQRQQIWYAYALKNVTEGWTPALRKGFFSWFGKARNFKGGASFGGFLDNFRKEALGKIADTAIRAQMDTLSKKTVALVPAGYESARKINVGVKPGMKFDTESISAKAGEKVAIVLVNNDPTGLMHNLAVCVPGSRQKVMQATLAIGPKAIEQNFIPDIPEVLASTPQVAPNRKFVLYMTIPSEPGDYPYICTYPGHAQLMHGTLKVTR